MLVSADHAARVAVVYERIAGTVLRVGVGFTRPDSCSCGLSADLLECFVQPSESCVVHFDASCRVGQRKPL